MPVTKYDKMYLVVNGKTVECLNVFPEAKVNEMREYLTEVWYKILNESDWQLFILRESSMNNDKTS